MKKTRHLEEAYQMSIYICISFYLLLKDHEIRHRQWRNQPLNLGDGANEGQEKFLGGQTL